MACQMSVSRVLSARLFSKFYHNQINIRAPLSTCPRAAPQDLADDSKTTSVHGKSKKSALPPPPSFQDAKPFDAIPGPLRLPFIGSLWPYKIGLKKMDFYHEHLREMYDTYGPIVREDQGSTTIIHVFDPKDIHAVYMSTTVPHIPPLLQTTADYKSNNALAPGLGNSNGPEWQKLRKAVNKFTLKPEAANSYIVKQDAVAMDAVYLMECHLVQDDGSVAKLENLIDRWITESMGLIVMDVTNGNLVLEENAPYDWALRMSDINRKIFHLSAKLKMSSGLYRHITTPKSWRLNKLEKQFYGDLHLLCDNIGQLKISCEISHYLDGRQPYSEKSIYYNLLDEELLNKEDFLAVTSSLLSDGYSTTAPTLLGALHCLALAPDVQEELYEQAQRHSPWDTPITSKTLAATTKIHAFIKEVLRLFPIGDSVQRLLTQDMALGGYQLPKGTRVDLNQYIWLRDPEVFPEPERVMLQRWTRPPQAGVTDRFHPIMNTPFSMGVRTCVGRRIAEHDLSVFILRLVQKFRVTLATPVPTRQVYRVLLRPAGPIPLRFHPRDDTRKFLPIDGRESDF